MVLDKKDMKVLEVLKRNAKLSTQQISRKTGIPITTVHHRIKKMEKDEVIRGYTAVVDSKKLGKKISAYIMIKVGYAMLRESKISQHELARKLKSHPFVEEASMLTGETDILLKVRVRDVEEMDEFITKYLRNIVGVEETHTWVILHEF